MSSEAVLYKRERVFSVVIRVCHWLRALAITALVITGFYISWPFLVAPESSDVLVNGWIRFAHEVFGFMLVAITMARVYLFFFSRSNVERRSINDALSTKSWLQQIKAYLWMGKPPHHGAYGPLQLVVYAGISTLAIFMCVTGLMLYDNVYHGGLAAMLLPVTDQLTQWMGGLANVRLWHHYVTWAFIIFVFIHIYMVVWTGIRFRNGSADSILSGYDYQSVRKDDAE
ncbi:Ni/Fe-hydrogenase, b-type cytochrome subunit [Photobacterium aphoticum]|uniref:Hydrogenase n=1 Tax=Photobacterium aphoticum TaxID=754436 RepID=A0A0J1GIF2_9GAMM|nr:Ni/Fe-hydrogenase, b-type cytochrome subunit [Photobacterium aphoticum]KLU99492.1 hydrogenase [Photobacterium aphoticum]PSU54862.1 Ni/Fe-hydrogenase, b-type cytochrome subunit [Photobacterium aphoticum]GHA52753.1 Ni/Fe-hydrogenase, b-type cytochrome subunit [Photobacterium aphoticum]